jgi:FtsH-binding integral membrane protein
MLQRWRVDGAAQATWNDPDYQDFARANGDCFTSTPPAKYSADADYTLGMNTTAMVLMYGSWAVGFALIIALACCMNNARVYPRNMILLGLFTLAQGTMLGTLCAFFQASAVLLAVAMTAIVVLALTAFACTTKIDFTGMGMYLYVGLIVLIMFGFFAAIFGGVRASFTVQRYLRRVPLTG